MNPEQTEEAYHPTPPDKSCQCNAIYESIDETLEEVRIRTFNLMKHKPLLAGYILRGLREDVHELIDRLETTRFTSPNEIFTICKGEGEHKFTQSGRKRRKR